MKPQGRRWPRPSQAGHNKKPSGNLVNGNGAAMRLCLWCEPPAWFHSTWPGDRKCPKCRKRTGNYERKVEV